MGKKENKDHSQEETVQDPVSESEAENAAETQPDEAAEQSGETPVESPDHALEEKVRELEDRYLRLAAEYDNFKRRTQREKEALYVDAVAEAVEGILPILDNLQRAAQSAQEASDVKMVSEGVIMTAKAAQEAFEKMGVAPIEAVGKDFDANLHNAVMHVEDDSVGENVVVEEFLKGYKYRDKVIRHSMVKVAN